jgi:hypothetical protein
MRQEPSLPAVADLTAVGSTSIGDGFNIIFILLKSAVGDTIAKVEGAAFAGPCEEGAQFYRGFTATVRGPCGAATMEARSDAFPTRKS